MEPERSSRSPSTDRDVIPDNDRKISDAEAADYNITGVPQQQEPHIEASTHASCPQEIPGKGVAGHGARNMGAESLVKKMCECGVAGRMMMVPAARMSGCSDCEETESDDDDVCSTSSDDSGADQSSPPASTIQPPMLPDVQLRVPMEDEDDVRRVRASLQIKGVLEVVCDLERQIVTVTGNVAPSRLLKKVRKVKRRSHILSTNSAVFSTFVNQDFVTSPFNAPQETPYGNYFDVPSGPRFAYNQRPRPTFQSFTFHNSPHSPYLRTYSPPEMSPPASPTSYTGDSFEPTI